MGKLARVDELAPAEAARVFERWLGHRSERTREIYDADLRALASHLDVEDAQAAVRHVAALPRARANLLALDWVAAQETAGVASGSIRRRIYVLRSVLRAMRTVGAIDWHLEVELPKLKKVKNVTGPGVEAVRAAIAGIETYPEPHRARLRLLFCLVFDLSLRANEPGKIRWPDDVELEDDHVAVWVTRKGEDEPSLWQLGIRAQAALGAWLDVRGTEPGPLLSNFDRAGKGTRGLTRQTVRVLISELGDLVNHKMTPNGLRHTANTLAIIIGQREGFTLDEVCAYTGHGDERTILKYYKDPVRAAQLQIAELIAEEVT